MASITQEETTPLFPLSADAPPRRNKFAFICAALASMTAMLMGYNLAVMSGAQVFIREDMDLTDGEVEVLTGCMTLFTLASLAGAGWVADLLGRRGALALANAFFMAGALAMSLGGSYAALMAARFLTSVGAGLSRVVAPVYNAEVARASTRGVLSCLFDIFINIGILLSYVSNYAFAGLPVGTGWRVMFAVSAVPPVLLAAAVVLAMPESPRWLAMRGRRGDAHAVLVRTSGTAAEADLRLAEINRVLAEPQLSITSSHGGVWKELLVNGRSMLRRVLALQFFQQASGIDAIVLYGPLVLKEAGVSSDSAALASTVAIGTVKTCFVLVAILFSDRVGRRPLLLASTLGVAVTTASLALTLQLCVGKQSEACLALLLGTVAAFSVGLGPVVPMYSAEVLPLQLRARGIGLAMVANRLTCAAVSMTFISLAGWITVAGCFFVYAGFAAVAFLFVYTQLPETRGRSLEDI